MKLVLMLMAAMTVASCSSYVVMKRADAKKLYAVTSYCGNLLSGYDRPDAWINSETGKVECLEPFVPPGTTPEEAVADATDRAANPNHP